MDNQFSCLGYYDGISVTEIPAEDPEKHTADKPVYGSHLFEKKSQACLSRVWSGTVHRAYGLMVNTVNRTLASFAAPHPKNIKIRPA